MKQYAGFGLLVLFLVVFAGWQMRQRDAAVSVSIELQTRLAVQAETITRLADMAGMVDRHLEQWRLENAHIAEQRTQTRRATEQAAKADPTLRDFLDTPLHPALLPAHLGGGGLLGTGGAGGDTAGNSGAAPGAAAAHPGP